MLDTLRHAPRRRFGLLLSLVLVVCAMATGCGGTEVEQDAFETVDPDPLDTQRVFLTLDEFRQLRDTGATVIDARATADYEAGHLPGALNPPGGGGAAWKDDNGILITDLALAQQQLRELGISRDNPVIIYGGTRSKKAPRLHWTLEYYGHGKVYTYLDGYEKLVAGLEETPEVGASPEVAEGDFVLGLRESIRATAAEIVERIDSDPESIMLIDTRKDSEYDGTSDRGDPRQGYIPGAVHYYFETVYTAEDTLRPLDELRTEFEALGFLNEDALLVPYCQTGTRSATLYLVLRALGRHDNQNYDGSWVEWSRQTDLPVAEGGVPSTEHGSGN